MRAGFLKYGPLALTTAALIVTTAHALIDADSDGMSDVWEEEHGFPTSGTQPAHQLPGADPDGDGWTNLEESQAGTDPESGVPPLGILRPAVLQHPDFPTVFTVSWPSLEGKQYTLHASPDLSSESWVQIDEPVMGTGATIEYGTEAIDEDGFLPERLFWKVTVADVDSDGDTLTDYEELAKGYNPHSIDTDLDGFPDNTDPLPLQSATLADPDGMGVDNAVATTGMVGWWDFQATGTGFSPTQYASRFAPQHHALGVYSGSQSFHCFSDKGAANIPNVSARAQLEVFGDSPNLRATNAFTLNYWIQLPEDELDAGVAGGQAHEYGSGGTTYAPATQRVVTLGAYGSTANHNPALEWRAVRRPSGGTRFELRRFSGSVLYDIIATGAWDTPVKIDDGQWHHVALRVSGGTIRTFLDGTPVGNAVAHTFTIPSNANTTGAWLIAGGTKRVPVGGSTATSYSDFRGRIDSVMVHRRGLTNAEVEGLYKRDRDSDQLWDITEVKTLLWRDNDSNGTESASELIHLASPFLWQAPTTDTDDDEELDIDEQTAGTQIGNPDSDGDLIPDGWEIQKGLDPKVKNLGDTDGDGLSDLDEYRYNSNPLIRDSDADGIEDGPEHDSGSHPGDGSDGGQPFPSAQSFMVSLGVGDRSGSNSEDYVLHVYHIDPSTGSETRIYTLRSGGYGNYDTTVKSFFRKGQSYSFQIDWQGTNGNVKPGSQQSSSEGPDFDYHLVIQPLGIDHGTQLIDCYDPRTKSIITGGAILDTLDTTPDSDDDDNVTEFLVTHEPRRVILVSYDILQVFSDQIPGNEANMLPTPFYKGEPNNPLLMATRTGRDARLAVEMLAPKSLSRHIYIGARNIDTQSIVGWTPLASATSRHNFKFPAGDNHQIYEIIAGLDSNSNYTLDTNEVTQVFEKTPRTDSAGDPATESLHLIDKIIVVTEADFVSAKNTATAFNWLGTQYAGDLISSFSHGTLGVPEATHTLPAPIVSNQPGMSHPLGARWHPDMTGSTFQYNYYDGTSCSNEVEESNGFAQVVTETITNNISAIQSAIPLGGAWATVGPYPISSSASFFTSDPDPIGINELGNAFGKVTFSGSMTVKARWVAGGKVEVDEVNYSTGFYDVYDFAYGTGGKARTASLIQAGHATLAAAPHPEAGRVFFVNVLCSGTKDIDQEY